jgi:hypothetical protein
MRFLGNTGRWEVRACADSDGDGRAEIFFQEPGGGVAKWFLAADGTFQRSEVIGNTGAWRLQAATPRIPGYGADLFWQRPGGSVYTWQWRTNAQWNVQHVGEVGNWSLCGSVDMNFDGTGDLVWQMPDGALAAWEMQTNCVPGPIHTWNRTPGWKLRAAGHGRLAVSLNPAVSPAADDPVGQANNWLASGTLLVNGNVGSTIGGTLTCSAAGSFTLSNPGQQGVLLILNSPTNGTPVVLTNSWPLTGGSLVLLTGSGTVTLNPLVYGGVFSNGLSLGTNFFVLSQAPITAGSLSGCLFTAAGRTLGSNLVGAVYAGSDGTLALNETNDVMVGTLTFGSVAHTLDGLTIIPPGDIYTNVTLQLLHGELIGTLSNGVFRVQVQ